MAEVFISYSHDDKPYVERLAGFMKSCGLTVWFDLDLVPVDQWEDVVAREIAACQTFVLVMSPSASRSAWVKRERNLAEKLQKQVAPLLVAGEPFWTVSERQYEDVRDERLPSQKFIECLSGKIPVPPVRHVVAELVADSRPMYPMPDNPTSGDRLIVIDDDPDVVHFVKVGLNLEGFDVIVAYDGRAALELIREHRPTLAIVDLLMPEIDGIELTKQLRSDPHTASIAIIMLTAKAVTRDKIAGLNAGADDYLIKPFDTQELVARVRSALRRVRQGRETSPLTGLPNGDRILAEISNRLNDGDDFAVCHVDIDRLRSVNDKYGYGRGDEFIGALARSLNRAVVAAGIPAAFLGHMHGGNFIVVCHPDQVPALTERTVVDFETSAASLYDPADVSRGYLELTRLSGKIQQVSLVTLSIGVAQSTDHHRYTDPREVLSVASEMKTLAASQFGSYIAVDQRQHRPIVR